MKNGKVTVLRLVEEEEEEEDQEDEEEEEEICKHGCAFIIYMVNKTRKPSLKQIPWKMTKLVIKLVEEEEDEEICKPVCLEALDLEALPLPHPS